MGKNDDFCYDIYPDDPVMTTIRTIEIKGKTYTHNIAMLGQMRGLTERRANEHLRRIILEPIRNAK